MEPTAGRAWEVLGMLINLGGWFAVIWWLDGVSVTQFEVLLMTALGLPLLLLSGRHYGRRLHAVFGPEE